MTDKDQTNVWPLPIFNFSVDISDVTENLGFCEVSGLDTETQIIEYRASNSTLFSTMKMPGIVKYGNVKLSKGIFTADSKFWDWCGQINMNTIKRQTVTIKLLDENGEPTMIWRLKNAWPTKISCPNQNVDGTEIAVESLELAHDGIEVETS